MTRVRLACRAMATRFELVLFGDDEVYLRAAGEAALAEIKRLEQQMSFYRPSSEISRINAGAARGPMPVEPRLFRLLQQTQRLHTATDGAFDITVGPLMRCWGFVNDTGHAPDPQALADARRCTGMHLVRLDPARYTIAFEHPGVEIDLGAIGKGFALDEAALLLEEAEVPCALLHGGTSTVVALGTPPEDDAWKIAVPYAGTPSDDLSDDDVLAVVHLADREALSVSAVWGKAFEADGITYGHVLDPRTGRPVSGAELAAAILPSATDADALSTALLVLGPEKLDVLDRFGANVRSVVVGRAATDAPAEIHHRGIRPRSPA